MPTIDVSHREYVAILRARLAYWSKLYPSSIESVRIISGYCLHLCKVITHMEQELVLLDE